MNLPASLTPLQQVVEALAEACRPLATLRMPVEEAGGAILAEPLLACGPIPARPYAIRAGYAVAATDLVGVSAYSPLALPALPPWVEAGGPLPDGADAVVPRDAVVTGGRFAEIVVSVTPGEGARRTGEDAPMGALLRPAGLPLRAGDVALARETGTTHVTVRRAMIALAGVRSPGFADILRRAGAAGFALETSSDLSADWLKDSGADIGVLLTQGQRLADDVAARGGSVVARGLAMRPGEDVEVALLGGKPLVALSPRVDVQFAAACALLCPILNRLAGHEPATLRLRGPLLRKLASSIGLTEIALVRQHGADLEPLAVGHLSLPALSAAQGWLAIPPESEGWREGETVEAFALTA